MHFVIAHVNDGGSTFGSTRAQVNWLVSMLQLKVVGVEIEMLVCKRFSHFEVTM